MPENLPTPEKSIKERMRDKKSFIESNGLLSIDDSTSETNLVS